MTSQRLAILHVLRHEGVHLSPTEIYKKARIELPGLTEPTVYRTLEFLAENGLARSSYAGSGRLTYEIAEDEHHHVICRSCGNEIEVGHALLESLYQELETASGFKHIDSHVTFFGVCPGCQQDHKET
ncbi:MAG TPA: Fur family transcriptional regulator [Anaerolineales bacterium]